jgi:limonene-1,2-epoxide hydrolase
MILTKEDLQAIINTMNPLIDARARTTEIFIKGFVREEIAASEKRMTKKIDQTVNKAITSAKKELREEILISRAEAKADHLTINSKVDAIAKDNKRRLEALEEATNTPNPNKH